MLIGFGCNTGAPKQNDAGKTCNCDNDIANVTSYSYKDDTVCEAVVIKSQTSEYIDFELVTCNARTNSTSRLEGRAVFENSINSETDEDENGSTYTVKVYSFKKGGCSIDFRFDKDSGRRLQLKEYHCDGFHDPGAPFSMAKILRPNAASTMHWAPQDEHADSQVYYMDTGSWERFVAEVEKKTSGQMKIEIVCTLSKHDFDILLKKKKKMENKAGKDVNVIIKVLNNSVLSDTVIRLSSFEEYGLFTSACEKL